MNTNLSEYEKLRLENMRRNAAVISQLDFKPIPKASKKSTKKKRTPPSSESSASSRPRRTSGRKREPVKYYTDNDFGLEGVAHDSEYEDDEDEGEDEDDDGEQRRGAFGKKESEGWGGLPLPRKARKLNVETPERSTAHGKSFKIGGIVGELAKTGRSTCRKCGEAIAKEAPRVGMQAWIVGRQAITWQCPGCFLGNLVVTVEASGRGYCKISNEAFNKGEAKLGARSHSATTYFKIDAAVPLLEAVAEQVAQQQGVAALESILRIEDLEGHEKLGSGARADVEALFTRTTQKLSSDAGEKEPKDASDGVTKESTKPQKDKASARADSAMESQPEVGVKSGVKGRVEWKWGGMVCSGILIPSRETNTHCYAKTHKGNVKTLTKGKNYWTVVA